MEANPYIMALGVILFTATGVYIIVSRKKIRRRAVRYYLRSPQFLKPFYFRGYLHSKKLYYANLIFCAIVSFLMAGGLCWVLLQRFL